MGVVGHLSRDIVLDGVSVVPSAGERMSTNTDATHFSSCYGQLILQNCVFDGHGDDAVNVHNYEHAFALVGGNRYRLACLAADGTHTQAVDLPSVGDEMQLIAHGTLEKGEKFVVIAAQANADGTCDVTFDRPLPVGSEGKYYLENATACPEFVFSHCRTRNHFARSVLIKTRRATVEKNIFEHSDLTAVVVAAEENWEREHPRNMWKFAIMSFLHAERAEMSRVPWQYIRVLARKQANNIKKSLSKRTSFSVPRGRARLLLPMGRKSLPKII